VALALEAIAHPDAPPKTLIAGAACVATVDWAARRLEVKEGTSAGGGLEVIAKAAASGAVFNSKWGCWPQDFPHWQFSAKYHAVT
jgi:hypothetical protein